MSERDKSFISTRRIKLWSHMRMLWLFIFPFIAGVLSDAGGRDLPCHFLIFCESRIRSWKIFLFPFVQLPNSPQGSQLWRAQLRLVDVLYEAQVPGTFLSVRCSDGDATGGRVRLRRWTRSGNGNVSILRAFSFLVMFNQLKRRRAELDHYLTRTRGENLFVIREIISNLAIERKGFFVSIN